MSGGSADIRVGDIVSRDGTDRHRVLATNACDGMLPDMVKLECIGEARGWRQEDGSRGEGWCSIGDENELCADDLEVIERWPQLDESR